MAAFIAASSKGIFVIIIVAHLTYLRGGECDSSPRGPTANCGARAITRNQPINAGQKPRHAERGRGGGQ
jgi:hypothetical protein